MALLLFLIVAASTWVGCQRPSTTTSTEAAPAAQPAATAAPAPASAAPADPLAFDPEKAERNDYGEPIRNGADFPVPAPFRRDTRTFTIAPLDGVEFNYRMEKGGTMVYSWQASGDLAWDFHGEPKGSVQDYAEGYASGESKEGNGAFMAPTSGIHGWFWENRNDKPVTLTLKTAGHFTEGLLTGPPPDYAKVPKPLDAR